MLRWGKNINSSKTRTKKRAGAAVYNRASSLETLVSSLVFSGFPSDNNILTKNNELVFVRVHKILMTLSYVVGWIPLPDKCEPFGKTHATVGILN